MKTYVVLTEWVNKPRNVERPFDDPETVTVEYNVEGEGFGEVEKYTLSVIEEKLSKSYLAANIHYRIVEIKLL